MWAAAAQAAANEETNLYVILIGGGFTLVGVIVTAVFGYLGHRQGKANNIEVKEINNAVNHKAPDQLRLFDMVAQTHERTNELTDQLSSFQRKVDKRLDTLDRQNAAAHRGFEDHIGRVESKVDTTSERFQEHIDWEQNVKWPSIVEVPVTIIKKSNPEPPKEATP